MPNRRLLAGLAVGCALLAAASGALADPPSGAGQSQLIQRLRTAMQAQQSSPAGAGSQKGGPAAAPASQGLRRFYGPPKAPPPPRFQSPMRAVAIQAPPPAQPAVQPGPGPSPIGAAPTAPAAP